MSPPHRYPPDATDNVHGRRHPHFLFVRNLFLNRSRGEKELERCRKKACLAIQYLPARVSMSRASGVRTRFWARSILLLTVVRSLGAAMAAEPRPAAGNGQLSAVGVPCDRDPDEDNAAPALLTARSARSRGTTGTLALPRMPFGLAALLSLLAPPACGIEIPAQFGGMGQSFGLTPFRSSLRLDRPSPLGPRPSAWPSPTQ